MDSDYHDREKDEREPMRRLVVDSVQKDACRAEVYDVVMTIAEALSTHPAPKRRRADSTPGIHLTTDPRGILSTLPFPTPRPRQTREGLFIQGSPLGFGWPGTPSSTP